MKALLAFRHGEAVVNRPDLFVPGDEDRTYPLTATGMNQARRAGAWATGAFDWVRDGAYVAAASQFVRAQQTYRYMGLSQSPPLILPGLNEQDWGDFMGLHPPEGLRKSFNAEYEKRIGTKAPHGESTLDLYDKLQATLLDLTHRCGDSNMVLVAHGRILLVMRMLIEGVPPTDAGWQYMRSHVTELRNCGALYYPEIRSHLGSVSGFGGRVVAVNPPYCPQTFFRWQPYLGTMFASP